MYKRFYYDRAMRFEQFSWNRRDDDIKNSLFEDSYHVNSLPKNYCYGSDLAEYLTDETSSDNFKPFLRFSRSHSSDRKPSTNKVVLNKKLFRRNRTADDFSPSFATLPSVDIDSYDPLAVIKESSDSRNHEIENDNKSYEKVGGKLLRKKLSYESRERRDSLKLDLNEELTKISKLPERYKVLASDDNSVGSLISDVRSKLLILQSDKEKIEGKVSSVQSYKLEDSNVVQEVSKPEQSVEEDEVFEPPKKDTNTTALRKAPRLSRESKIRSVSVTIQEIPEIFDAKQSPSSISKNATTANPQTKSTSSRGSLKKIPSSSSIKKPSTSSNTIPNSSDYGRSRPGGHRESFKKNDRTNDRLSEQDRDVIDREHKDGSLNRSLSNTDTNIEDRIGKISLINAVELDNANVYVFF